MISSKSDKDILRRTSENVIVRSVYHIFSAKKYRLVQVFLIVFNVLIVLCYKTNNSSRFSQLNNGPRDLANLDHQSAVKSILLWNGPQRAEVIVFGNGREVFKQQGCPVHHCEIIVSPWQYPERPLDSYDAIVINLNDEMWLDELPNSENRKENQRYVFFTQEPPSGLEEYPDSFFADNYYNWTMTYRLDSDIPLIYGRIQPKEGAPTSPEQVANLIKQQSGKKKFNRAQQKSKLAAWMVSHCITDGRREDYVKQMQKYVNIDIYGDCGTLKCNRHELFSSSLACYDMLENDYKFYLSFENSICTDYVTEKFFNIISRNIVPVVYGGADYDRIAPPHSYIDARKFEPKQLASYLKELDANDTLYNEYFWWKEYYAVESGLGQMAQRGFCNLCQKLHEDNKLKSHTLLDWQWKRKKDCLSLPKY